MAKIHAGIVSSTRSSVVRRVDEFKNALTGLGNAMFDKLGATVAGSVQAQPDQYYENLIRTDRLARRIASLPAREMLRQGYEIEVQDDPEFDERPLMDEFTRLDVDTSLVWALTLARAVGGAAIVPLIDDGGADLRMPLNVDAIRTIESLSVVSKKCLTQIAPESAIFMLQYPGSSKSPVFIHESRLIRFDGERVTDDAKIMNLGWGDSIFLSIEKDLQRVGTSFQAVSNMLIDSSQAVFKLKDFQDIVAGNPDGDDAVRTRIGLMNFCRSVIRAIVLDADTEDFAYHDRTFSGIPDSIDRLMYLLSAVTGIPVTLLFGRSPAGMNATGDADIRFFYDQTAADQTEHLKPRHTRLAQLVMAQRMGPLKGRAPLGWCISYNPLWQLSATEQADVGLKTAQADQIYIDSQVALPEEIAISRFGGKTYSTRTQIDTALREAPSGDSTDTTDPSAGAGGDGSNVGHGNDNVQQTVLNGAQVTSLVDVVKSVSAGELPRESGVQIVMLSFGLTNEQAEKVMADAGNGFEPTKKDPPNAIGQAPGNDVPQNRGKDVPSGQNGK